MTTETLLVVGVIASVTFVVVLFAEGALRSGYNPVFHTGSELSLGDRGWIQRANFAQMAVGTFAFALGVHRTLDNLVGATLLSIFGLGMLVAGIFIPDPRRGYPPGAPITGSPVETWQHQVHAVIGGPVAFFAIFAACLMLAGDLDGLWRVYTVLTAITGLVLTASTAIAWQKNAAYTGFVQRCLILVYWTWLGLIGIHSPLNPPTGWRSSTVVRPLPHGSTPQVTEGRIHVRPRVVDAAPERWGVGVGVAGGTSRRGSCGARHATCGAEAANNGLV